MIKVRFTVWFKKENRLLHFSGQGLCDEYDTLTFELEYVDKTTKYRHLSGDSYIPNSEGVIVGLDIN